MQIISDNIGWDKGSFFCRHCGRKGYKKMAQVKGHLALCPVKNALNFDLLKETDKAFLVVGFLNKIGYGDFSFLNNGDTIIIEHKIRIGKRKSNDIYSVEEAIQLLKEQIARYKQHAEPALLREIEKRRLVYQAAKLFSEGARK